MREVLQLKATSSGAEGAAIVDTQLVTISAKWRKHTSRTTEYEHHLSSLGGQLYFEGTNVTFWLKSDYQLEEGNVSHETVIGGLESKDIIVETTIKIERFSNRISSDLYNTPGLDQALTNFKTDMNMAMNRCVANLKVNLWRIGATLNTQKRDDGGDEGPQSGDRHGVPKGQRGDGKKKGDGSIRGKRM